MLSKEQIQRYEKHLLLPEVGEKGQKKLLAAKVLLIGVGSLGSATALYLATAGVGTLGLMDGTDLSPRNIQQQVIHKTAGIGRPKVESARETLQELNPDLQVITYAEAATEENLPHILAYYDLVVDCSDRLETHYLINDFAVIYRKPYIYGSLLRFDGQVAVLTPPTGPCYRCLFPALPAADSLGKSGEIGVFSVTPGLVGMIQAAETIKLILDLEVSRQSHLLSIDALKMEIAQFKIARDPACLVCGERPAVTQLTAANHLHC